MGWTIECCNKKCGKESWANNIVDLINDHRDKNGWFLCSTCQGKGYIQKSFRLQERDQKGKQKKWEPCLRGAIELGEENDSYQPFIFVVGYSPEDKPEEVWFSYYKDLRKEGGRLKVGHGPGGPPVLSIKQVLFLVETVAKSRLIGATTLKKMRDALNRLLGE